GLDGIAQALAGMRDRGPDLEAWWAGLSEILKPLEQAFEVDAQPLGDLLTAHITVAESLAASDAEPGIERLWREESGEALAAFLEELQQGPAPGSIEPHHYPALLDVAMAGQVVRPRYGTHPRLAILGPLEARLHHADVVVLGGLNEASWPPDAGNDPWMSRPMKSQLGLPLPERRIGLSAHDFAQAAATPAVYLTRAEKVDGEPTIPSRWLLRLDAVLGDDKWPQAPHLAWHQGLDAVEETNPYSPPAPTPPLAARPRKLSVTQVELWMRDPYALYARHILGLKPLDPLDADPGAAERGTFVHDALERFVTANLAGLPTDALEQLIAHGRDVFGPLLDRPLIRAFWWPR
ncbi:MAG: PD-(D/E)XK nuclease family protein, partial [Kiloniellales bacterium]|nr:PD-(D/E)XK nuclease family protein [Kiloniellales bacterium]